MTIRGFDGRAPLDRQAYIDAVRLPLAGGEPWFGPWGFGWGWAPTHPAGWAISIATVVAVLIASAEGDRGNTAAAGVWIGLAVVVLLGTLLLKGTVPGSGGKVEMRPVPLRAAPLTPVALDADGWPEGIDRAPVMAGFLRHCCEPGPYSSKEVDLLVAYRAWAERDPTRPALPDLAGRLQALGFGVDAPEPAATFWESLRCDAVVHGLRLRGR